MNYSWIRTSSFVFHQYYALEIFPWPEIVVLMGWHWCPNLCVTGCAGWPLEVRDKGRTQRTHPNKCLFMWLYKSKPTCVSRAGKWGGGGVVLNLLLPSVEALLISERTFMHVFCYSSNLYSLCPCFQEHACVLIRLPSCRPREQAVSCTQNRWVILKPVHEMMPYSGFFSRGVNFADFAERAQFVNFETTNNN
jgi:hypothetical protein